MNLLAKYWKGRPEQQYKQRVFTTGFTDRNVSLLPELLQKLNAVLIDIRLNPNDRKLQWRQDYLKLLLKDRYRHVSSLGNRAGNDESKISIQNLNLGIKVIIELKVNLMLMCSCRNEAGCHRKVIAQKLEELGIDVREISDWEASVYNLRN